MKSRYKNYRRWEIFILIAAGVLLVHVAVSMLRSTGWSCWFASEHISNYGSFLGGVATVISIYYLYRTLREQGRQFQIQNFEGRFLELISFNRDAVSQMSCIDTSKSEEVKLNGKSVFEVFQYQIEEAIEIVTKFVETESAMKELYLDSDEKYKDDRDIWGEKLLERNRINIAFLIAFFGVKPNGYKILSKKYLSGYNKDKIDKILRDFRLKLSASQVDPNSPKKNNPVTVSDTIHNECKYFAGFQYSTGNYFRTLFHCVSYVNKQPFLSFQEKYGYIKMLRCQMSNAEEMVLFYDSISDLGLAWEYDRKIEDTVNNKLITKYNIIKNIPIDGRKDLPAVFYPNVIFENLEHVPQNRNSLENQYT